MGKRTREKTDEQIKSKIKRLEKELKLREKPPDDYIMEDLEYGSAYDQEVTQHVQYSDSCSGSGHASEEEDTPNRLESVVGMASAVPSPSAAVETALEKPTEELIPVQEEQNSIPLEILAVLGEAKQSEETLGKKIPTEISERWGKILIEGLTKEVKQTRLTQTLIPENFQLAKAPKLNAEVASVLSEPSKNRDKRLEKMQNQLGTGIAGLANLTSELINQDLNKLDIIKQISEINQILLDLHYEETLNRRRLIIPLLDKSFINIIQGVKRNNYLFGDNLGDNIKTTKSIEKSSLQIKRFIPQPSTSRRPTAVSQQGNARAPPRQRGGQGAARAPQTSARFYPPPPPPAARRPPPGPRRPPPPPPPAPARPQDRRNRR